MSGLNDISFHAVLDGALAPTSGTRGPAAIAGPGSPESVARKFLESRVAVKVPSVRGTASGVMSSEDRFDHVQTTVLPAQPGGTKTTLVSFQQCHKDIPIFGARPTVELDGLNLLAVSGKAAEKPDKPVHSALAPEDAEKIAARGAQHRAEKIERVYFHAGDGWHLAYHVMEIRVDGAATGKSHGPGGSPRSDAKLRNVLVDAHDGTILLDYSATPMVKIAPSYTTGLDEDDVERVFYTQSVDGTLYELRDGLNVAATYDHVERDITIPRPENPVREGGGTWESKHRAAISAHNNATIVLDYFRSKLKRSGLDNLNTELTSIVRCTYDQHDIPPVWRNAVWWKGAMWYGQNYNDQKRMVSFATHLEVAAHEMTHGLIEKTANLIYLNESGALNESFADIFGIIISNSARVDAANVATWSWIIGKGLGENGADLRDFRDPQRLSYPDQYKDRYLGSADEGGVHINSNIHNKAAYNVLAASDANGFVFTPDEVALLYYLTLLRLGPTSTFQDCLQALLHATATLYSTRGPDRALDAIRSAYAAVGIIV